MFGSSRLRLLGGSAAIVVAISPLARAATFAQYVPGSYVQGTVPAGYSGAYTDPTILGNTPQGITGAPEGYPGVVSVFNAPFDTEPAAQLIVIGTGGQVELQFPQPVTAANNFQVGVFTNATLVDADYPNGQAGNPAASFSGGHAVVSVSQNGTNWVNLGLATFDIPENYYLNAGPYDVTAPANPQAANFGEPFTGTLADFNNLDYAGILKVLNGSAGGTWLNLAGAGLPAINYIEFYEDPNQLAAGSYLSLEAVSVADPVPEPAPAAGLVLIASLFLLRRARNVKTKIPLSTALCVMAGLLGCAGAVQAGAVNSVQFQDGNAMSIQGVYGSGSDTAYLAIDLNSAGPDYAWQFNWNPGTTVNGWQMLEDIAGQSVLSTSGVSGTTHVSNSAGDPNLTITATYYTSFAEHEVLNMQYAAVTGTNDDWDFDTGTYSAANVSAANPQGMTWASAGEGIDEETLSNGEFIGWVDVYPHPPLPTLAEVPEPSGALPICVIAGWLLTRRASGRRPQIG